jgi:hypothetical protein
MTCCGEALLPVVLVVAPLVPELFAAPLDVVFAALVAGAFDDALGDIASPKAPPLASLSSNVPPDTPSVEPEL